VLHFRVLMISIGHSRWKKTAPKTGIIPLSRHRDYRFIILFSKIIERIMLNILHFNNRLYCSHMCEKMKQFEIFKKLNYCIVCNDRSFKGFCLITN